MPHDLPDPGAGGVALRGAPPAYPGPAPRPLTPAAEAVADAVRAVLAERAACCPRCLRRASALLDEALEALVPAQPPAHDRVRVGAPPGLTDREEQVLVLLADGLPTRLIAHRLGISPSTVRKHLEHAYAKLGVHDRVSAVNRLLGRDGRGPARPVRGSSLTAMRVDVLSREYPPEVYGGAGVHVAELVAALRASGTDAQVRCFGAPRTEAGTTAYAEPPGLAGANPALRVLGTDLAMVDDCAGADLLHSHTWYAHHAGHLGQMLHGLPHVVTAHSLEPLRPWKAEQLGGGYALSSWVESQAYGAADAVIAVSAAMRDDVLRCYPTIDPARVSVVHNGIDVDQWVPVHAPDRVRELGVDPDAPTVVFVGRITRQKGLPYFLRAARLLPTDTQLVLCAGAPDTPEIAAETEALVDELRRTHPRVVWIAEMLPRPDVCALLTAATVFVCPSVYEPLGIVNLEAMACETAVVATATGGIPEVVVPGETGWLVPIEQVDDGTGTPVDPPAYEAALATTLTEALADPDRARAYGLAGRDRATEHFGWPAVADRTRDVYARLLA